MLDWHTIGNLEMEMFQDPMYVTSKQETFDFWRKISGYLQGTTLWHSMSCLMNRLLIGGN